MSLTSSFKNELFASNECPTEGSKLYIANPVQPQGEEESIGCFVSEGEGSIMKMLKELNMKLDLQTAEIMQLKAKLADHEATLSDHKAAIQKHEVRDQRWLFNNFINYLVQLLYGLEHALIISLIPNAYKYFPRAEGLPFR